MSKKVIVVTGAAGFLGSSISVILSQEYKIFAIDQRQPSSALAVSTPGVQWKQLNIADATTVNRTFKRVKSEFEKIDYVIHLAAYYHFGNNWRKEYEHTNVIGTENIVNAAIKNSVQRIIFTSSIASMEPPLNGQMLNEKSPSSNFMPYARSKSIGEKIIRKQTDHLPGIVLRLGGVFSDWCELPPLYSLIKLWSACEPFCRIVPGRGESGIPYIHLSDIVQIIKRCLTLDDLLEPFEIFLASQHGVVLHKDIFSSIRQVSERVSLEPIHISPGLAKIGLAIKLGLGTIVNKRPFERPWMLKFIDHPWVVDNRITQKKLNWHCNPGMGVLYRLPVILKRYQEQRTIWIERNIRRANGKYIYLT